MHKLEQANSYIGYDVGFLVKCFFKFLFLRVDSVDTFSPSDPIFYRKRARCDFDGKATTCVLICLSSILTVVFPVFIIHEGSQVRIVVIVFVVVVFLFFFSPFFRFFFDNVI